MENQIQELLSKTSYHADTDFSQKIWLSISKKQKQKTMYTRVLYSILSIASCAILIPVCSTIATQLQETGFIQYLSIAFSDIGSIGIFGKQLLYALGEALPTLSIALFLFLVASLVFSLKELLKSQTQRLIIA
ncbi:MAG: hypothetical protein WCQ32_02835 [bacterium]